MSDSQTTTTEPPSPVKKEKEKKKKRKSESEDEEEEYQPPEKDSESSSSESEAEEEEPKKKKRRKRSRSPRRIGPKFQKIVDDAKTVMDDKGADKELRKFSAMIRGRSAPTKKERLRAQEEYLDLAGTGYLSREDLRSLIFKQ